MKKIFFCLLTLLIFQTASFASSSNPAYFIYNQTPYIALSQEARNQLGIALYYNGNQGLELFTSHGHNDIPDLNLPSLKMPMPYLLPIHINGTRYSDERFPFLVQNGILYMPYISKTYEAFASHPDSFFKLQEYRPSNDLIKLEAVYNTFDTLPLNRYIRNQGSANTCWAISANTLFELYLFKTQNLERRFSVPHMIEFAPIPSTLYSGGNFNNASAYYLNGLGPQLENQISPRPAFELEAYKQFESINDIKSHILKYGAVLTSIYYDPTTNSYYNEKKAAYYNPSDNNPITHDILLIGWDNDFSKNAFTPQPKSNGAFIALNSFGSNWGENGLFYISYEDVHAKNNAYGITKASSSTNYDYQYYYNDKGITHFESYKDLSKGVARVIYKTQSDSEWLTDIGLYTGHANTNVEIYFDTNEASNPLSGPIAEARLDDKGFHKLSLKQPFRLPPKSSFVITAIYSGSSPYQIPVQAPYPGIYYEVSSEPNNSYIGGLVPELELMDMYMFRENGSIALRAYTKKTPK